MQYNTISVIGLGYIGLPTAAMFASKGKRVIGVDVNKHAVETINKGKVHIVEPELDETVKKAVDMGFLKAALEPEPADAFLISVPTPFFPLDSTDSIPKPNLTYIEAAAKSIARVIKKGDLIILESTSPVGTTEQMALWLADARPDLSFPQTHGDNSDIRIAYCPERVLPGNVLRELVNNDRVIGGMSDKCSDKAIELYKIFVKGECFSTNSRTAEMTKLTENSCRDVQIAFANELSIICDELDINVWELIALANRHPRISILQPGPGVGGHCIAVDPWFIVSKNPEEAQIIHTARLINDAKPEWTINKVKIAINDFLQENPTKNIENVTIACLGLAFKPDIDDLRESPAMSITQRLAEIHQGKVIAVEPNIHKLSEEKFELVKVEHAIAKADIVILLVDHKEFKMMKKPETAYVIDTKGVWK
jgi:UDP-N-acetyl-D-mannosaminuronic acid dehydrogenase